MPLISFSEIVAMIIVSAYLGILFTGYVQRPKTFFESIKPGFDVEDFKFAVLVSAPAVILHELAHKFVAMALGFSATFFAFYHNTSTLFLAIISIILKFSGSGFIFLIPGFVSIPLGPSPLQSSLIAFAGPFMNLFLWLGSALYLKISRNLSEKWLILLTFTRKINMILFFFNMIPLGFFDGAKVFQGLFAAF